MTLKRLILMGLLLLSIVPLLLTSAIQMVTINFWSQDLVAKNLEDSAQSFKAIIEDFFTQQSIDLNIVSHTGTVKDFVLSPSTKGLQEVQQALYTRINDRYYLDFYLLYNEAGELVGTTHERLSSLYPNIPKEYLDLKQGEVRFSDYISHPLYAQQEGAILAFSPIIDRGIQIGYIGVGYNNSYFAHMIENVSQGNNVKVRLEDSHGEVVSTLGLFVLRPGQPNNFEVAVSKIDFDANPTGTIMYDNYQYEEIAYYTPISKTGLRLYTSVNLQDYHYPSQVAWRWIGLVLVGVVMVVLGITLRLATNINTYMENMLDTMIRIKNGDYTARLLIPGKHEIKYIADTFNDLLMTIEHNNEELYQGSERYRLAVKMFSEVFFELDIVKDEVEFGATKWTANYNLDKVQPYHDVFGWFLNTFVYEEDQPRFIAMFSRDVLLTQFREMELGSLTSVSLDFRWIHPTKKVQWVSLTLVPVYDKNGMISSMVGYIKNINDQKNKELDLIVQAQQDGLTQINNKVTTQRLIEEVLHQSNGSHTHALMVMDLDDFKAINDTHGHLAGDDVLRTVADLLRTVFRSSDIVGRIGGDEFMVFMHNVSKDVVIAKAQVIVSKIGPTMLKEHGVFLSCSLGVAMYPLEGEDFMSLYEQADKALYEAKEAGKNQFRG